MDDKQFNQSSSKRSLSIKRKSIRRKSTKKKNAFTRADQLSRLELYEKYDSNHPLNQQMRPEQGFNGPKKQRSMTDQLCILFLIIFFSGQIFHGIVLFSYGNINKLSNGLDFRSETCGQNGLIKLPYLYFAQPQKDINVAWCVEQCPTSTGKSICIYDIDHFTPTTFCYVQMTSTKMGRYCIPKEPVNRAIVDEHLSEPEIYVKRMMSDIYLSWDLVVVSMILLALSAYLFTYLLSFPSIVKFLIWGQIWCAILCFGVLAYLFWREYERIIQVRCLYQIDKHYCGGDRGTLFQLAAAASGGIGLLFLLNIMKLFNKINLGISLIRAASKVVDVLAQLRFFAIFISILGFLQFSYSCGVLFFGMTIGESSIISAQNIDGSAVKVFVTNPLFQYTLPYQAFMILFFLLLILSVNEMFNSYAISIWFFTKKKATVQIPLLVVLRELIIHHLGTCVFAVFMEILLFIPKWILYLVQSILRNLPQELLFVRFLQGCCLCCLACYQNCLRYLSKHALVQVAIWSEGYWTSSKKAFFLLHRNQDKVFDLDFLIEFILFLLKISNSLLISLPIYFYLNYANQTLYGWDISDIESPLIPTLFVFIIGFFYVSVFQVSYDITTKSVIQLYLVDREMFYGEQRFTEQFIQEFMEFYGKNEELQVKYKSHKQLKYNAQVAPLKQQAEEPSPPESSEEEDEDEDENEDIDLEEEPQYVLGNTQQSKFSDFKKKTHAHHIDADPFQLEDNLSNTQKSEFYPAKSSLSNQSKS